MKLTLKNTMRTAAAAAVALTMAGGAIAPATAQAEPAGPSDLERKVMLERAETWTSKRIPYSQAKYYKGYRTDCSGFISMAWGLDESYTTFSLPEVAHRIDKDELKPGDVMLNRSGDSLRHVVMFGGWADKAKTKYVVFEQTGQDSVESAIKRVVPYPYRIQGDKYVPYRLNGKVGPEAKPAVKKLVAEKAARVEAKAAEEKAAAAKAETDGAKRADADATVRADAASGGILERIAGLLG